MVKMVMDITVMIITIISMRYTLELIDVRWNIDYDDDAAVDDDENDDYDHDHDDDSPPIRHTVEERPESCIAASIVVQLVVSLCQPHRDHLHDDDDEDDGDGVYGGGGNEKDNDLSLATFIMLSGTNLSINW